MHTKRSFEAIAVLSGAGVLISGEATYVQFAHTTLAERAGTLFSLPLPLFDLVAFGLVFIVAVSALWRRVYKVMMP